MHAEGKNLIIEWIVIEFIAENNSEQKLFTQ